MLGACTTSEGLAVVVMVAWKKERVERGMDGLIDDVVVPRPCLCVCVCFPFAWERAHIRRTYGLIFSASAPQQTS